MKAVQKGFTLIELMIVVAIIGILAAVALPAYSDYQQRTQVAGAAAGVSAYKTTIGLCISSLGTRQGCDNDVAGIGPEIENPGVINYIDALVVENGEIRVTTSALVAGSDTDKMTLTFIPNVMSNQAVDWSITGTGCDTGGNNRGMKCPSAGTGTDTDTDTDTDTGTST